MAILVQCTECKRKYYADDKTAGKRVRCKHCGALFDVPPTGGATGAATAGDPDIESMLEGLAGPAGAQPAEPMVRTIAPVSSELNAVSTAMDRPDDVQAVSLEGETPVSDFRRPNWAWRYPGSGWVDDGLPWFLVVVGLGFMGWQVWQYNTQDTGLPWVAVLRISILLTILLGMIFPLGLLAVHAAAKRRRYALPPWAAWRILSALVVPFVLGVMMWLPIGSVGGLVIGTVVGLAIAALGLWVLLRLRADELPLTAVYAAAGYLGGAVVGIGLLLLVNLLVLQSMTSSGSAANYRNSPLGRHLSWNPPTPPPVKPKKQPAPPTVAIDAPNGTSPTTSTTAQVATTTRPAGDTPTSAPFAEDITPPQTDPNPPTNRNTSVRAGDPRSTTGVAIPAPALRASTPIISAVQVLEVGKFDEVIYPLVPGQAMATVHRGAEEDEIVSWTLAPLQQKGSVRFRHEAQAHDRYILSPGGELVARLVNWPAVAAQVWSFDEKRLLRHIDLNKENRDIGTPYLLGFVGPDTFVIKWQRGGATALGAYGAAEGNLIKSLKLPTHDDLPGNVNYAFSPDGKAFALAAKFEGKPVALLFDLLEARMLRRVDIPLDARWPIHPAGFAFSPDGLRLGALFEQHGNGLLVAWNIKTGATKLIAQHIYPGGYGFTAPGEHPKPTDGLVWLREDTIVLFGQGIFDIDSGRLLGEIGLSEVKEQQVVDPDTLHLVLGTRAAPGAGPAAVATADSKLLAALTIDSDKLTEMREQAGKAD